MTTIFLFLHLALANPSPDFWVCGYLSSETEFCPGCGFTYCLCVEAPGWMCLSEDRACNTRRKLHLGITWYLELETWCAQVRSCTAPPDGCYPLLRPCTKGDEFGLQGAMTYYSSTGFACQP
jgi:hypothetical protein